MKMSIIVNVLVGLLIAEGSLADGSKVKLGGYCPVAYVGAEKALFGNAEFQSEHEGNTYYFINKEAKGMFDKEPKKFVSALQYDSWCATALAMGKKLSTDPKLFSSINGKIYLFSSAKAKEMFDKDSVSMIKKADDTWSKVKGNADKLEYLNQ